MRTIKQQLELYRRNPALTMHSVMLGIEEQLGGQGNYDVPDATNPFVFTMETAIAGVVSALDETENLLARLYPSMALDADDLYRHMSDEDYLDRFATPAWTTFDLVLSRDEVFQKAVTSDIDGVRKLVIPRHTQFMVGDTGFTLQYPIELRIMSHGGLQVVYDTSIRSPIHTLESNVVDWDILTIDREKVIVVRIPVGQFVIQTHNETINASSGFDTDYRFTDSFYFARVYLSTSNGQWEEIHTTHSEQVYDPLKITAVLKVENDALRVSIPQIYFSTGLADREIRIDIYTTKGKIDFNAGGYQAEQFEIQFNSLQDDPRYVSPLNGFSRVQALNQNVVTGGTRGLTFEELRQRVINNALGRGQVPITSAQLRTELGNRGYDVVTNVDNITNRQFLASRRLPSPSNAYTSSPIGCTMGQLQNTMEQLNSSTHVVENGLRSTIMPSMLYRLNNGRIEALLDHEIQSMTSGTPDAQTRLINNERLLYSPMHYVLDASNSNFDVRPYYLDSPAVVRRVFVEENDTSQYQVTIREYELYRTEGGYSLFIRTGSGEAYKDLEDELVTAQLTYRPVGENTHAALTGTLVGKQDDDRIFQFDILTNYDIDQHDAIRTTNFSMFSEAQTNYRCQLEDDFDLHFIITGDRRVGYRQGDLDRKVQQHLLPNQFMVVSCERLRIRMGHALGSLWRRNRSLITETSYRRYEVDVPYVYSENVYERDANGQIIVTNNNGTLEYNILHRAGDPVLDDNDVPVIRHRKGDVVLDANGQPELINPRKLLREYTLFLVDGKYYFVTDPNSVAYRESIAKSVVDWVNEDLDSIEERLLEESELYLYPTTTLGNTVALVRESQQANIALDQNLYVNYYMNETAHSNINLRESLIRSTREIVSDMLDRPTVSVSDIITRLKANAGEDVISIDVGGLGGADNYSIVSIDDRATRMSLRKRLIVLSNQLLAVQDDIDINFLRHTVN